jgi:hypothetical protein
MNVNRTWKVLDWPDKPAQTRTLPLCCPHCGHDAHLEMGLMPGAQVIAAIGLGLIFEPAGYVPAKDQMPTTIKCRHCRRVFSNDCQTMSNDLSTDVGVK